MKKVKLSLNKSIVARLNGDEQGRIQGGEQPTTMLMGCLNDTDYPICGMSGCWGAASCLSKRPDDTCRTNQTENVICYNW